MNYNNKDHLVGAMLVVGWDKHGGGQVFGAPIGGTLSKEKWAIDGSGSTYIWGYCDSEFRCVCAGGGPLRDPAPCGERGWTAALEEPEGGGRSGGPGTCAQRHARRVDQPPTIRRPLEDAGVLYHLEVIVQTQPTRLAF